MKLFLQEKINKEFGLLENTSGDSIDFKDTVGELTFIQFLEDG